MTTKQKLNLSIREINIREKIKYTRGVYRISNVRSKFDIILRVNDVIDVIIHYDKDDISIIDIKNEDFYIEKSMIEFHRTLRKKLRGI